MPPTGNGLYSVETVTVLVNPLVVCQLLVAQGTAVGKKLVFRAAIEDGRSNGREGTIGLSPAKMEAALLSGAMSMEGRGSEVTILDATVLPVYEVADLCDWSLVETPMRCWRM